MSQWAMAVLSCAIILSYFSFLVLTYDRPNSCHLHGHPRFYALNVLCISKLILQGSLRLVCFRLAAQLNLGFSSLVFQCSAF